MFGCSQSALASQAGLGDEGVQPHPNPPGTEGSLGSAEQWPLFKTPLVNLAAFTGLLFLLGTHHKKGGITILASLLSVL